MQRGGKEQASVSDGFDAVGAWAIPWKVHWCGWLAVASLMENPMIDWELLASLVTGISAWSWQRESTNLKLQRNHDSGSYRMATASLILLFQAREAKGNGLAS